GVLFFFFFFQAEDGIRDLIVTGVQTCALPIYRQDVAGEVHVDGRGCRSGPSRARSGVSEKSRVATNATRVLDARKVAYETSSFADRKSTRLNSSHDQTSYAVFCLKKKTKPTKF